MKLLCFGESKTKIVRKVNCFLVENDKVKLKLELDVKLSKYNDFSIADIKEAIRFHEKLDESIEIELYK